MGGSLEQKQHLGRGEILKFRCFALGFFKTANPLWPFPGKAQRYARDVGGAAHEVYLLPDSQMKRSFLAPLFFRIRPTHGSCCQMSKRGIIEFRTQKAKLNHFKPSQGEPSLPGCTLFVTPPFLDYFLVTTGVMCLNSGLDFAISVFACLLAHGVSGAADSCSTEGKAEASGH